MFTAGSEYMKNIFILILTVIILTGCASTKNIKSNYSLNSQSGKGVLISSISVKGSYSGYSVYFQSIDNEHRGYIEFGAGTALLPIFPEGDFSHLDRKGEVFAVELPAGKYKVWRWGVASGYAFVKPAEPMSIEFEVIAGKATYIGNFDFIQTSSLGLTVTGVKVNYSDQFKIDTGIIINKYPNIELSQIDKGIIDNAKYLGIGGNSSTNWDIPIVIM
jgi:hypothetical protein